MITIAAAVLITLPALQEKELITLRENFEKGSKLVRTLEMSLKTEVYAFEGDAEGRAKFEHRWKDRRTVHIVDVENGRPMRVVHDIQEDTEDELKDGEWTKTKSPLMGKRITIARRAGILTYEGADGIEARTLDEGIWLESDGYPFFSKKPVAVGDAWQVDDKYIEPLLEDLYERGKIGIKLIEIRETGGKRCADLRVNFDFSGSFFGLEMRFKLEADTRIWLDRGQMLYFRGRGTCKSSGRFGGRSVEGTGTITLDMNSKLE
jgi:hypothetical protein